jgi:type IV conjugative transfer system protein TraL
MYQPQKHILLDALDRPLRLLFWTLPQWSVILLPLILGILVDQFLIGLLLSGVSLGLLNKLSQLGSPRHLMALRYRWLPPDRSLKSLPPSDREEYPR